MIIKALLQIYKVLCNSLYEREFFKNYLLEDLEEILKIQLYLCVNMVMVFLNQLRVYLIHLPLLNKLMGPDVLLQFQSMVCYQLVLHPHILFYLYVNHNLHDELLISQMDQHMLHLNRLNVLFLIINHFYNFTNFLEISINFFTLGNPIAHDAL